MEPENDENNPPNPAPANDPGLKPDDVQQPEGGPTERETLLESQLSALQSSAVNAAIEATGYQPRAVLAHTPLADLLTADGTVDPEKVQAAATAAAAAFGLAHVPVTARPKPVTTLGNGHPGPPPTATWSQVLQNR